MSELSTKLVVWNISQLNLTIPNLTSGFKDGNPKSARGQKNMRSYGVENFLLIPMEFRYIQKTLVIEGRKQVFWFGSYFQ